MINKAAIKYIEPRMNNGKYSNEQLVARIQAGDNVAENMLQLWKQNEGFIAMIAKKYLQYAEMEELEQEGYIALCNAVQGYKHEQGMSFINYAAFYMHRQFERCANNNRSVPLPYGASSYLFKYKKIYAKFFKEYNRKPSNEEMKRFLGVNDKEYDSIKKALYSGNMSSLSKPIEGSDEELTLGDVIAEPINIEEECIARLDQDILKKDLWEAIDELEEEQRKIIYMRFKHELTLQETGDKIGKNLHAVRTIQDKAIRNLRCRLKKLKRYAREYMTASPLVHVGVSRFNRTWTSGTEIEAIRNYERSRRVEDELNAILRETDAELEAIKTGTFSALWSNG